MKLKQFRRAMLSVIGWAPWRDGRCGALAIARPVPESDSSYGLRFAGIVEVGFSEVDRIELGRQLAPLQHPSAPPWRSHRGQPVYAVAPELRIEVQLLESTDQGQARHLSHKGRRSTDGLTAR